MKVGKKAGIKIAALINSLMVARMMLQSKDENGEYQYSYDLWNEEKGRVIKELQEMGVPYKTK